MAQRNWRDWKRFIFNRDAPVPVASSSVQPKNEDNSPETLPSVFRQMFNEPFFSRLSSGGSLDEWFGDFSAPRFTPTVDVVDDGATLRVSAELPGMDKDDIKLSVDNNHLIIEGEKKIESESREEGCYRVERSWGTFQRSVPLPTGIDVETSQADFKNGVLSVHLPKNEEIADSGKTIAIR